MKAWSVFLKSLREQIREPISLVLILVSAPAFVLVYWMFFGGGHPFYTVLILNQDRGAVAADRTPINLGTGLIDAIQQVKSESGQSFLITKTVENRYEAQTILSNHKAAMLLVIPPDFSSTLLNWAENPEPSQNPLIITGDLGYPQYIIAAGVVGATADQYFQSITNHPRPFQIAEEALGASSGRSDFELYVPGLLVVAITLLIFQSSMAVSREVETGALRRLQLTRMSAFDLLAGITASQVLIGILSLMLTFLVALSLGFHSSGPIWAAFLIGALTTLSVIGCGLIVACFARSVSQAFIVANFPLIALMFFSGAAFPVGEVPLLTVAERTINLFDILPPTHAVVALNKIMGLGAGFSEVTYEVTALVILSLLYFSLGVYFFRKTHLRPQ